MRAKNRSSGSGVGSRFSLSRRFSVDELAAPFKIRFVKPLCARRMNTRSLLCEDGMDAMVAGCDCPNPKRGMQRKTCWPGFHDVTLWERTLTLVTPPGKLIKVALPGLLLLKAERAKRLRRSRRKKPIPSQMKILTTTLANSKSNKWMSLT